MESFFSNDLVAVIPLTGEVSTELHPSLADCRIINPFTDACLVY